MGGPSDDSNAAVVPDDKVEQEKIRRARLLRIMHWHYFLGLCHAVMPFSQRQTLYLQQPQYGGDIGRVAVLMASMTSAAGAFEFLSNPILGKLSDAYGRKSFLMIGPAAQMILNMLVWLKPSTFTLGLQTIIGNSMSTFSGTTCTLASLSDIFAATPNEFAVAMGDLANPVGFGLMVGPLVGSLAVRASGGKQSTAFLASVFFAGLQLLNAQRMPETLEPEKTKPFVFSLGEMNPLSFLKLFQAKGQSTLAKISLVCGALQNIDEGKNVADVHQSFAMRDVGVSEEGRANFVSAAGVCLLINVRSTRRTLTWFGGRGHTAYCNFVEFFMMIWFATVPLWFRKSKYNAWPLFIGLLLGCTGWSSTVFLRACGTTHAGAAGIGNGEYSAMLANMRSVVSTTAPVVFGQIYKWSTSDGRYMPGLAYKFASVWRILCEIILCTMSTADIEGKSLKAAA